MRVAVLQVQFPGLLVDVRVVDIRSKFDNWLLLDVVVGRAALKRELEHSVRE